MLFIFEAGEVREEWEEEEEEGEEEEEAVLSRLAG